MTDPTRSTPKTSSHVEPITLDGLHAKAKADGGDVLQALKSILTEHYDHFVDSFGEWETFSKGMPGLSVHKAPESKGVDESYAWVQECLKTFTSYVEKVDNPTAKGEPVAHTPVGTPRGEAHQGSLGDEFVRVAEAYGILGNP